MRAKRPRKESKKKEKNSKGRHKKVKRIESQKEINTNLRN
jgi:hypothetical protein